LHEELGISFRDFKKVRNQIQPLTCGFSFYAEKDPNNLQVDMSPPSSGSKNKASKKPA
jgi:hypothetical protein